MSNARLAGLVGALVAYAGGSVGWAATTLDNHLPVAAAPGATSGQEGPFDLDFATLRQAQEHPAKSQARPGLVAGAQSDSSDVDTVVEPRNVQTIGRPSPTSWLLLVIGVGMIGGALRGFMLANRALARLQPEERE
ncbi:MAG TPA: hypothetical protein VK801_13310 [Caulobacteraceae bacterium]|jgi:hypothetical protein|nr:hypothetical protein [Caulobacteraceae bacterium]